MVYAAAFFPADLKQEMANQNFAGTKLIFFSSKFDLNCIFLFLLDSKTLSEHARENIFSRINAGKIENIGWIAKVLSLIHI